MSLIVVNELKKDFKVVQQQHGFTKVLKSFFKSEVKIVNAVRGISFSVDVGEVVGFIGENGAGKSTTIKIMSGILYPTSGEVTVNGMRPYENRKRNAMNIGVIFGQRTRLMWDLPMQDSFELYKEIYRIPDETYKRNVAFFTEILNMGDFLKTPVRQLSLGQRMKVDISLSLLHDPKILYLDEPTIGLDVLAKSNIREFIIKSNAERGTSIILTSHDMKDLDHVCNRIVLISKGSLIFDGKTDEFKRKYGGSTLIKATFARKTDVAHPKLQVIDTSDVSKDIIFNKTQISLAEAVTFLSGNFELIDMTVKEPDIEEIVRGIYAKSVQEK
ncbi:MAG: ATP-binding cassette domain-containing protein [Dehalococcoidales bacterium]|nr:ATP-binding cassette domain-containing protein [Dehalococcoidales bacterium]